MSLMCNFGVRSRFLDVIYGVRPPNGSPAITHTITIKWKEKYNAVEVDCHHNLRLCGDRICLSKKKKKLEKSEFSALRATISP